MPRQIEQHRIGPAIEFPREGRELAPLLPSLEPQTETFKVSCSTMRVIPNVSSNGLPRCSSANFRAGSILPGDSFREKNLGRIHPPSTLGER